MFHSPAFWRPGHFLTLLSLVRNMFHKNNIGWVKKSQHYLVLLIVI